MAHRRTAFDRYVRFRVKKSVTFKKALYRARKECSVKTEIVLWDQENVDIWDYYIQLLTLLHFHATELETPDWLRLFYDACDIRSEF